MADEEFSGFGDDSPSPSPPTTRGRSSGNNGGRGGAGGADYSGITEEEIARFEAAFYGPHSDSDAQLSVGVLREWLTAMGAPAVPDGPLRVSARGGPEAGSFSSADQLRLFSSSNFELATVQFLPCRTACSCSVC